MSFGCCFLEKKPFFVGAGCCCLWRSEEDGADFSFMSADELGELAAMMEGAFEAAGQQGPGINSGRGGGRTRDAGEDGMGAEEEETDGSPHSYKTQLRGCPALQCRPINQISSYQISSFSSP